MRTACCTYRSITSALHLPVAPSPTLVFLPPPSHLLNLPASFFRAFLPVSPSPVLPIIYFPITLCAMPYALRSPSGAGSRRTNLLANHLCCTRKTQQKGPVKVQPLRHEAQRMNMKFKFLSKREESIHWFRPLMLINPKISCKFSK